MKNRMQDLDFEQTVAFDKVQDYEFTRRAAQRFRQVVSLDIFEEEDADEIFHYLYKEMELVSFCDHLKRYIYERAELEEPFSNGLMYPKEPGAPAADRCNCRCIFDDVPRWYVEKGGGQYRRDNETGEIIECKNYAEFKEKYLNN